MNSAYYAIPGGVSSLARAISYIGFDTVHQLVLSTSIINALEFPQGESFDLNKFWEHSIGVGIAAETLAKFVRHPSPSDMFTCGLVHDMGKIAMYMTDAEEMVRISDHAVANNLSYFEAEEVMEAPHHTVVGQMLAEKWNLPTLIQAVIKNHHQKDPRMRGGISAELSQTVDIIYIANLFTHALKFGKSGHNKILGAPKDVMERLRIDAQKDFKPLIKDIKVNLERGEEFIRVIGGGR
ncbi:MAG: HDOD domain-containing protein [Bdellovibrionales bacterium]|nr:HDOD domain-containing protein [Bdellovibrionales bacterium]